MRITMSFTSANSSPVNDSSRCQHRFANGRRCRLLVSRGEVPGKRSFAGKIDSGFCLRHAKLPENQREPADLAATLTNGLGELTSAASINDFLSRLLLLLAQDRISPRRAAVLAYVTNQILRTVSAMEQEAAARNPQNAPVKVIWDIPGPANQ
jgi:hypothetical protein